MSGYIGVEIKFALVVKLCANEKDADCQDRQGQDEADEGQQGEAQYNKPK